MAHPDATIIWGAQLDPNLEDEMRIIVVATGLGDDKKEEKNPADDILSHLSAGSQPEDDGYITILESWKYLL